MTERRKIEELAVLYELEPQLADVFVEGPRDRAFVEWLANEAGLQRVTAYEIDTVDVPLSVVEANGNLGGNRGRVVAFAQEIARLARVTLVQRVAGLIDADLDRFHGPLPSAELLIVSDFPAIESYLFSLPALDKYVRLILGTPGFEAATIIERIGPVIRELFIVRVASRKLGVRLQLVDFASSCSVKDGVVTFNRAHYIGRYIRRDGFAARHDEFVATVNTLHEIPVSDVRIVVHGHDFVDVLTWYGRVVLRASSPRNSSECGNALRGCIELAHLAQSNLLRELKGRFGDGAGAGAASSIAIAPA